MKSGFSIFISLFSSLVFLRANVETVDENLEYLSNLYNDSWAVIIGINQYDNMKDLKYAVSDAADIKEMFINKYDFKEDHIKLILDKEATRGNITRGFSKMLKQAGENDRVVIFFAGHGETFTAPNGGNMGYLIPTDGDLDDLYLTSISMNQLYEIAAISSAKHILYLVDACYSGLAISQSRGISKNTAPSYLKTITTEKGRQIITAGGKDEEVIENSIWGHSAFTKNLLTGLGKGTADIDGDGIVTANELGDFLAERVHNETDGAHTPQIGRIGTEMGEFIFIYNPYKQADGNAYKKYKQASLSRSVLYRSARTISRVYPGLGHLKLGQKKKGLYLAAAETVSLGLTVFSWNNFNVSHNKYLDSKKIYDIAGSADYQNIDVEFAKQQYLSDHETYQLSTVQFGVSLFASMAIWIYNIYDINKLRYNYTEKINYSKYNVNISPMGQLQLQLRL
jgi:hypothetical protein